MNTTTMMRKGAKGNIKQLCCGWFVIMISWILSFHHNKNINNDMFCTTEPHQKKGPPKNKKSITKDK